MDALRVEVRGLKERVSQLQSQQAMLLTEHHTLTRLHAEQDRELRVAREELEALPDEATSSVEDVDTVLAGPSRVRRP